MNFLQQAERTAVRVGKEVLVRIIIDTSHDRILFVPEGIGHAEYLAQQLGKTRDELKQEPELVQPYVGAVFQLEENMVAKIHLGVSSIERLFSRLISPVHTKEQLEKARNYLLATLQAAKVLAKGFEMKVVNE